MFFAPLEKLVKLEKGSRLRIAIPPALAGRS
jgi:hypothetical protein